MTDLERLKEKLISLRLKIMAQHLEAILKEASEKNRDSLFVLNQLAELEAEYRWHNAIKLRFQQSKLNEKITIDQFDFNHHKSRRDQKTQILNLLNLDFVKEHKDVIVIGNPGTGKTFLAKCIAYAACSANIKVLFTTAIDMINHLIAAEADCQWEPKFYPFRELKIYPPMSVLVVFGPSEEAGLNLFLEAI